MNHNLIKPVLASLAAVSCAFLAVSEAQATPAFARQMSMNCMSCHTQTVPLLNSYGRQFKLSGFSMANGKEEIKGGDLGLSLPMAINAGVGFKSNYLKSNGARDDFSSPAGASIMVGGKIAEDAGVNTMWNSDGLIHMQGTFTQPVGEGRAGFSIYGTQGHGPFIATESYNSGLHKEISMFDNPDRTNAAQATGLGKGPASGLAFFYGGHGLTISGAVWAKGFNSTFNNKGLDADGIDSTLYRVSYDLPELAAWNISVGAFGLSGSTTGTPSKLYENTGVPFLTAPWANSLTTFDTKARGIDMQVIGAIAGMSSQVVVTQVADWKLRVNDVATGALRSNQESKASSIEAQIMPLAKLGIRAGRMVFGDMLNSNNDYGTVSLGVVYNYADNVRFSLERTEIDNSVVADVKETMVQALILF